jgi:hypothetical protein
MPSTAASAFTTEEPRSSIPARSSMRFVPFDLETLAVLKGALDEAWTFIPARRNGNDV